MATAGAARISLRMADTLIIANQRVKNVQIQFTNTAQPEVKPTYQEIAAKNRSEKSNPSSEQ
jgi:hypothetical protein